MQADIPLHIIRAGLEEGLGRKVTELTILQRFARQTSTVLSIRVMLSGGEPMRVWAKMLRGTRNAELKVARTARDFDLHALLHRTFGTTGPFRVPRPLFHSPEHRLIVTGHVDGYRFQDRIKRDARGFASSRRIAGLQTDCHRAGQWLQAFQAATAEHAPGVGAGWNPQPPKTTSLIVEQTEERLAALLDENPAGLGGLDRDRVVAFLHERQDRAGPDPDPMCSIHGDFFPGNLITAPDSICAIDFSSCTWGSRWFDASYFVFQLETLALKPWFRNSVITRLAESFLAGYGENLTHRAFWQASPTLEILLVCHFVTRLLSLTPSAHRHDPRSLYRRQLTRGIRHSLSRHVESVHQGI